jgi:hypothetical protein
MWKEAPRCGPPSKQVPRADCSPSRGYYDLLSDSKRVGYAQSEADSRVMLRVFGVAPVASSVIQLALELPFADFEDAVTSAAAQLAGCDFILTRDPKGFRASPIRLLTPEAAAPLLQRE